MTLFECVEQHVLTHLKSPGLDKLYESGEFDEYDPCGDRHKPHLRALGIQGFEGQTIAARNLELKEGLSRIWKSTQTSPQQRLDVAKYYVNIFGGVSTKVDKLGEHVNSVEAGIKNGAWPDVGKGVASWSKIAAAADPENYAILDARVAAALNALQLLHATKEPTFFLPVLGLNETVNVVLGLAQYHVKMKLATRGSYEDYLRLLHNVAESARQESPSTQLPLAQAEVVLFVTAKTLAEQARKWALTQPDLRNELERQDASSERRKGHQRRYRQRRAKRLRALEEPRHQPPGP